MTEVRVRWEAKRVGWGGGAGVCVCGGGGGVVMGLFEEQMENCRMQKGRGD